MKQHQTKVSKLTRDVMIFDLMNTMGWTRSRAIAAIEELEQTHLVYFPEAGGLRLQVVGGSPPSHSNFLSNSRNLFHPYSTQ